MSITRQLASAQPLRPDRLGQIHLNYCMSSVSHIHLKIGASRRHRFKSVLTQEMINELNSAATRVRSILPADFARPSRDGCIDRRNAACNVCLTNFKNMLFMTAEACQSKVLKVQLRQSLGDRHDGLFHKPLLGTAVRTVNGTTSPVADALHNDQEQLRMTKTKIASTGVQALTQK